MTLALIGFTGGLITGISPCILPVLPVIFFTGAHRARRDGNVTTAGPATATIAQAKPRLGQRIGPYLVIAGLVASFSVVTLAGSALLTMLHLPQDAIRWAGLVALALIGLGLIVPGFQHLLERPFARIPQRQFGSGARGFGLGLALGVLYVPCAGPVLAAIMVAGATGSLGAPLIALTVAFALGAALPLLVFALAGRRVAERVKAFRRHEHAIRIAGGVTMIALAMALVFNLPAVLQRAMPDYTHGLQDKVVANGVQDKLNLGGIVNDQNRQLSNCTNGAAAPQECGPAPDITGITGWLNTPGGQPVNLTSLRGKVVLIDFWAYSCINCQRAIPHVVDWYHRYRTAGLQVIGVHTPEYAFEKVPGNVAAGAAGLGITYPIALDNRYSTWTNYRNRYWPAEYLIDAGGTVRHIKFGEGDYGATETLIRRLLSDADPGVKLPPPADAADTTPPPGLTPETYLSVGKVVNYSGTTSYEQGSATFGYPGTQPADTFALDGPWTLDYQGATADSDTCTIRLNYHAKNVYLVAGGTGTVTVNRYDTSTTIPIRAGPPDLHQILADGAVHSGQLEVRFTQGLQAFSFTYG